MKFIAATFATLSMLVSASAQADPTKTREDVRMVAPALEKYAQSTLLGDVWKRPGLSVRDRSVVTLAALIARNQTVEMAYYLNVALDNGVKPAEISEIITHLYQRRWKGAALGPRDYVLCTDEKTSIQARRRKHASLPPAPGRPVYVEHEYARLGAWAYLAAWDVHRAKLFGRCERKTGIVPFERLVAQVMRQQPYRSARRVFWIADNGSSHRGNSASNRLRAKWPNIVLVHTPVHASWLNQIEVYFSIVQRKLLTRNDFSTLADLKHQLMNFQTRYQQSAKPFEWTFTRRDLDILLAKLNKKPYRLAA